MIREERIDRPVERSTGHSPHAAGVPSSRPER